MSWMRTITCDWENNALTTTTNIYGEPDRFFTLVWAAGENVSSIDSITPPTNSNGDSLETWRDEGTWKARDQMVSNTYTYSITFTDNNGIQHTVPDPEIINNPNG